jgi:hypothetical protein
LPPRFVEDGIADDEAVCQRLEHGVPLSDARLDVLDHLIVRVGERQELSRQDRPAGAERR